ncbi:FCD domain-containing protein [Bifidobacterium sp. ESL0682]|uniref:FadR/GntR family transcriptional regulator n=1 Tax=Bifidobacterium sp. ESL0682 TaxID=2983212 RepID=UPI0023F94681|nr:FCD domain-containing protein [Bifidobacterium sp. ESL0682]WEV42496.1 FCD domain-containing protein [Bifidobacterium sp. ESL0682]
MVSKRTGSTASSALYSPTEESNAKQQSLSAGKSDAQPAFPSDSTDPSILQQSQIPMHHAVAEQLAVDIIENRWKPGTSITLNDIQERFSISRTVAREAAHALQSAKAIIVRKRVGLIAQELNKWLSLDTQVIKWKLHSSYRKQQLLTLTELRLAVEPVAAGDAALHAPMETRALMPVLASEMRKNGESGNLDKFHELDVRFHNEILINSGNELFAALSPLVDIVLKSRVEQGLYPAAPRPDALDAHEKVAEGIWKGDAQLAHEAMTHIVAEVRTTTQNA